MLLSYLLPLDRKSVQIKRTRYQGSSWFAGSVGGERRLRLHVGIVDLPLMVGFHLSYHNESKILGY